MAICWNCGKTFEVPDLVTRQSECPHCSAYLRCCRGCEFYEASAHNECREPQAELVADKEVSNSCDYYRFEEHPLITRGFKQKSKNDLNDLFKD